MEDLYKADVRQSNGDTVTFLMRYSKPTDPIYQEGALVYYNRVKPINVDRLDSHIAGLPCIGIEFGALNYSYIGGDETYYNPVSINAIPEGIKWIGDKVFFERYGNENVKLPESVEYIGEECFAFSNIDNMLLPSNIRKLGSQCFGHTKLKEIVVPGSLKEIPSSE